jgi:tRNA A37 threonylcarbamoyladenosine dehydratase
VTAKLEGKKIAIVGVGCTGSYILDLVAKTPVSEIHMYDDGKVRRVTVQIRP